MKEIKTSENRLNKFDFFFPPNDVYLMGSYGKQYKRGLCVGCAILHKRYKKIAKTEQRVQSIDAHRGGKGEGGGNSTPQANFRKTC